MSSKAQAVIQEFNNLPQIEQLAVYQAIARKVTEAAYGPLSDEDLTAIAAETFALLDQEENPMVLARLCFSVSVQMLGLFTTTQGGRRREATRSACGISLMSSFRWYATLRNTCRYRLCSCAVRPSQNGAHSGSSRW
jgi:hypothetical protein